MVQSCTAFGCDYRFKRGDSVKLHSFPVNPESRKKWVAATRRKNFTPTKASKLCSQHFEESCYEFNAYGNKVLKKDVVPTIFGFSKPKRGSKEIENGCNNNNTKNRVSSRKSRCLQPIQPKKTKKDGVIKHIKVMNCLIPVVSVPAKSILSQGSQHSQQVITKTIKQQVDRQNNIAISQPKLNFLQTVKQNNKQTIVKLVSEDGVPNAEPETTFLLESYQNIENTSKEKAKVFTSYVLTPVSKPNISEESQQKTKKEVNETDCRLPTSNNSEQLNKPKELVRVIDDVNIITEPMITNGRKRREPAHVGDFQFEDLECLRLRKKYWSTSLDKIDSLRGTVKLYRKKITRHERRIERLLGIIKVLNEELKTPTPIDEKPVPVKKRRSRKNLKL